MRDLLYIKERLEEVAGMLPQPVAPATVLGVVVEIGLPNDTILIAGYANGDARLLWDSGGGMVGDLYNISNIAEAAKALCDAAQYLPQHLAVETTLPPLPAQDIVRIAVLTMDQRFATQAPGPQIVHPDHPLHATFTAANNLFEQLQALQEKTKEKK
jgi:hypothetical protein